MDGNATFNTGSTNNNLVTGDAYFACEAVNNGTVNGTVTEQSCAPQISTLAPVNGATDVAVDTNLVVTFDRPVTIAADGGGYVTIYKYADDSVVQATSVTDPELTATAANQITVTGLTLDPGTQYYVHIDSDLVRDATLGYSNDAVQDNTTWTFTTAVPDITPPSTPTDFTATPSGGSMDLVWVNPMDPDFASVTIRRSTSSYPATILDGTGSPQLSGVTGTSVSDTGLDDDTYYYSIFAVDATGNVSDAAHASGIIDTITEEPEMEIAAPESGSSFTTNETMHITFTLPEDMHTGTFALTFTPVGSDADPIIIHLRDAESGHSLSFTLLLNNLSDAVEVTSATANSIPAGTYIAALSYQDSNENPTASAAISGIVISEPPVSIGGGGAVAPLPTSSSVGSAGNAANPVALPGDCLPGFAFSPSTGKPCTAPSTPTDKQPFLKDLRKGMDDPDVARLQHYLALAGFPVATSGFGSIGNEVTTYGVKTAAAVAKFQKAKGITPASGFFGTKTRKYVNDHL